jgi:hypothetical protein
MSERELAGRAAIVTGASRNIGRAIALALGQGGASVLVHAGSDGAGAEETARLVREAGAKAQTFVGLHNPPGARAVARTMAPDHGFCPEMLDRTKALVLADVCAKPQFASNPVVDKLGVRTYAGAPLVHERAGMVLGSVCVVGTSPLPKETRQTCLALIKRHRNALVELLGQRASASGGRHSTGFQGG